MPVCLSEHSPINYIREGNGYPIVLLHGWGASAKLMMPITLAVKGYSYIVPDFYGHGNTPHPNYPLSIVDYANSVITILKEQKITRAHFVCHSFGGRVGIYLASCYPTLVNKLILVDSAGLKPKRRIKYYTKRLFYIIRRRLGMSTDKCGSADYKALDPIMKGTFVNVVNYHQDGQLSAIASPTLIVWGELDKDTPYSMAKKFKRKIPRSRLRVIKGVGHFSYAEDIKTFKKYVEEFLKE